ncbi:MAG: hypothetical protein HRU19_19235 [Pseudobacteriovorax sp.]|nr:hypothetical protein [Pseudobacteriovorax sp.]
MATASKGHNLTSNGNDDFQEVLADCGFVKDANHNGAMVYQAPEGSGKNTWHAAEWRINSVHGRWRTDSLKLVYSLDQLSKRLRAEFESRYGRQTQLELIPSFEQGLWVLFEVYGDNSRRSSQDEQSSMTGTVGFHFSLTCEGSDLCLHFSKHFMMGQIPDQILSSIPHTFMKCFDLRHSQVKSQIGLFESRVYYAGILKKTILSDEKLETLDFAAEELGEVIDEGIKAHLRASFDGSTWVVEASTMVDNMYEFDVPPIEIVETRELGQKHSEIDSLILGKQAKEARDLCLENIEQEPDSLFLLRRLCLSSLALNEPVDDQYLKTMVDIDSENLLFLSAAVQTSIILDRGSHLLKFLSRMGQLLNSQLNQFEELKTMDVVLPELLGDGWSEVNVQTAQACYQRVLLKRGDVSRVIWKMVRIARETEDTENEVQLLNRLVEVEQDKNEAAACYMRLSELYQNQDMEAAAECSLKGWKLHSTNTDYAEIASYNLVQVKDYEKAVRVLDDCRKLIEHSSDQTKKVDLELLISRIWFTFLKRRDLAKLRIEHAMAILPEDIENLKRCEDISEEFGEEQLLVTIRQQIFDQALAERNKEEVFRAKAGLLDYLLKAGNHEKDVARIYEKTVNEYLVDYSELYTLLDFPETVNIDWQHLLSNIESHLLEESVDNPQPFYIFIGEVADSRLGDKEKAAQSFERALEVGSVESNIYDFLNEYYAEVKQLDRRDRVLVHQLQNADEGERVGILKELFYTSENSTDQDLDSYAIMIMKEGDDDEPIKKRFLTYQGRNEIDAIDNFLEEICAEIFDRIDQFKWMKFALDILADCDNKQKYPLIEKVLKDVKPHYKDIFEWYEAGVHYHQSDKQYTFLEPYLNKLILNGIPPNIDKRITLQVLKSNPIAKGLFYRYLANQEESPKDVAACLRQALDFLMGQAGYESTAEGIISQLADIVILTNEELANYQKLTEASNNADNFYRIVDSQLKALVNQEQFSELRELAFSIIEKHPDKKIPFAGSMLKCVESFDPQNIVDFRFDLLEINVEYREFMPEVWGIKYLRNLTNWKDEKRYSIILDWILENKKNRDAVGSIFKENMIKLRTKRDYENLDRFSLLARTYGFSFNTYNWYLFQHLYNNEEHDKATYYWLEFIRNIPDPSSWKKFYHDTAELLPKDSTELVSMLHEAYKELQNDITGKVLSELSFELGVQLFHHDREINLAHSLIKARYVNDQTEKRAWFPLYFLNSMLKKPDDQYSLLTFLIPVVDEDPELIGDYPITLESLHKEFTKVSRQLKRPDKIAGYTYDPNKPAGAKKKKKSTTHEGSRDSEKSQNEHSDQSVLSDLSNPANLGSLFADSEIVSTQRPKRQTPIPKSVRDYAKRAEVSEPEPLAAETVKKPVDKSKASTKSRDRDAEAERKTAEPKKTRQKTPLPEKNRGLASLFEKSDESNNDDGSTVGQTADVTGSEKLDDQVSESEPKVDSSADSPSKDKLPFLSRGKSKWPFSGKSNQDADEDDVNVDEPEESTVAASKEETEASDEGGGWREWLMSKDQSDLVKRIEVLSFPSRVEKYVALQAAALCDDVEPEVLKNFNWLDFVEPWDGSLTLASSPIVDGDLYRVIKASKDFLGQLYQEKYSLRTISRVFGLTIDKFLASRASIQFTELFSWPWAESYQKILEEMGIEIVFIEGPQKVLYEARKGKLYVSQSLAISPNPDLLYHILFIVRSAQLGLFEVLMLKDRLKDPLIEYLQKTDLPGIEQSTKDDVIVELQKPDEMSRIVRDARELVFKVLFVESRNLLDLVKFETKQEAGRGPLSPEEKDAYIQLAIKICDSL